MADAEPLRDIPPLQIVVDGRAVEIYSPHIPANS